MNTLEGQYDNPVRVVGFIEVWARDVSGDTVAEIRRAFGNDGCSDKP